MKSLYMFSGYEEYDSSFSELDKKRSPQKESLRVEKYELRGKALDYRVPKTMGLASTLREERRKVV